MRVIASFAALILTLVSGAAVLAEEGKAKPVSVGVPTLLSGDWAGLGQNIVNTVEVYRKFYLRHPLTFTYEDAKISGLDGLKAYQKLVNLDHVDVLIGATSSNGTMAAASLINASKTVMITPVTGGSNVDGAGEFIFRIGNSDVLNATEQAELFRRRGITKVATLTEQTEYTEDIRLNFEKRFKESGGQVVYSGTFLPAATDFRSELTLLLRSKPEALFIPTQTGSSLALILKQISELGDFKGEIHTTFTAADNPDARALAKGKFSGLYYLAPAYDKANPRLLEFLSRYKAVFNRDPLIPFHTAATVDALDLLQLYLDKAPGYDADGFKNFLLGMKKYHGLMGEISFDANGNADTGFVPQQIE